MDAALSANQQAEGQQVEDLKRELAAVKEKADKSLALLRSIDTFDRGYLFSQASMAQRIRYHALARHIKADAFAAREELARTYPASLAGGAVADGVSIPRETGLASFNLSQRPEVRRAVDEAMAYFAASGGLGGVYPSKQSLEFVGSADKEFGADSALFKLASSPLLVAPIAAYFGVFPMLSGFGVTLARNNAFHRKSSQRLHFDPEDRTQIKAFVYLTDVDTESGPFMAAPADQSAHVYTKPDFVLDRLDDSIVAPNALRPFFGPAGTVTFCDTCRCLHAGAREGKRERLVLSIEYNIPSFLGMPLLPQDAPLQLRTRAIQLETSDPYLLALLGRAHV